MYTRKYGVLIFNICQPRLQFRLYQYKRLTVGVLDVQESFIKLGFHLIMFFFYLYR